MALNGIWPLERERETNHYILELGFFGAKARVFTLIKQGKALVLGREIPQNATNLDLYLLQIFFWVQPEWKGWEHKPA